MNYKRETLEVKTPVTMVAILTVAGILLGLGTTIVVAQANNPPSAPTITGPTTGYVNVTYTYSFTSTDPEGDNIKYQIDWNNDGTVDQEVPINGSGYTLSGTSKSADHSWVTSGTKDFQARTVDIGGSISSWAPYSVTIADLPATQCTDGADNETYTVWCDAGFACFFDPSYRGDWYVDALDPGCHTDGIVDDAGPNDYAPDQSENDDIYINLRTRIEFAGTVATNQSFMAMGNAVNTAYVTETRNVGFVQFYRKIGEVDPNCTPANTLTLFDGSPASVVTQRSINGAAHCIDYDGSTYRNSGALVASFISDPNDEHGVWVGYTYTSDGQYEICYAADATNANIFEGYLGDNVSCRTLDVSSSPKQCDDGVDNVDPEDTLIDENDPGCHDDGDPDNPGSYNPTDDDENDSPPTECNDNVDNTDPEDILIDENDPGCHTDGDAGNPGSYDSTDDDESDSAANNPPNDPVVTGPATGLAGVSISFDFSATDPDSDDVRIEIDWDNDGTPDETTPSAGYVTSGTVQTESYTWNSAGTYTIGARAEDINGEFSGWTTHDIDVTPAVNLQGAKSGDALGEGPITISSPSDIDLQWTTWGNPDSCQWTGPDDPDPGNDPSASGGSLTVTGVSANATYEITCSTGAISSTPDSFVVNYNPLPPPIIGADELLVRSGATTTITWDTNGHTGCSILGNNGDPITVTGDTGSADSASIYNQTTYTITCDGDSKSSVVITLSPTYEEL